MSSIERPEPSACYTAALELVKAGISVIPIQPGTKEPPVGLRWGPYTQRFADASELYTWFEAEGYQLAVICGPISGKLVVIDFDRKDKADGGYADWALMYPAIRKLPRVKTGKGRVHVYCRVTEETDKYTVGEPGQTIEVRSGNHYCVAPPSIHPETGAAYIWSELQPISAGVPTIDLTTIGFEPRKRVAPVAGEPGTEGVPLTRDDMQNIVEIAQASWLDGQRHDLALCLSGWLAGYSVPETDARAIVAGLAADEDRDGQRKALEAVRDTYRKWRDGIAVAGWSRLTDSKAPLISPSQAKRLELIVKGRQASISFDVVRNPDKPVYPYIISVTDLLAEPDEPDEWIINGLIRARSLGLTVGPPKTYKSFLEQELHIAVATGTPAFGIFPTGEPRVTVYIQEESSRAALRRRFRLLLNGKGIHPAALEDTLFTITNQGLELDNADSVRRLIDDVMRVYNPAYITLDPLREVHNADENSSKEMRPILKLLKELREEFGPCIQVVHHNNKNPLYDNPADSIRGTTSIWGAMDGAIFVGTTEHDNVMQVNVRLKEGGEIKPFFYTIEQGDGLIRLNAFDKPAKGSTTVGQVVAWAKSHGGWWPIEDILEAFPSGKNALRGTVKVAAASGLLKVETLPRNRKLYAHAEVDSE